MKEYIITINDHEHRIIIKKIQTDTAIVEVNGKEMEVGVERKIKNPIEPLNIKPVRKSTPMDQAKPDRPAAMQSLKGNEIIAPLPGLIIAVQVKAGDRIKANQTLIKMEAMKMENEIKADRDGVVKEVLVKVGDAVLENAPLIVIGD